MNCAMIYMDVFNVTKVICEIKDKITRTVFYFYKALNDGKKCFDKRFFTKRYGNRFCH